MIDYNFTYIYIGIIYYDKQTNKKIFKISKMKTITRMTKIMKHS